MNDDFLINSLKNRLCSGNGLPTKREESVGFKVKSCYEAL